MITTRRLSSETVIAPAAEDLLRTWRAGLRWSVRVGQRWPGGEKRVSRLSYRDAMTDIPWEPPWAGTETEHLVGALERLRCTFRWKVDDLGRDGLQTHVGTSALTLGGLLSTWLWSRTTSSPSSWPASLLANRGEPSTTGAMTGSSGPPTGTTRRSSTRSGTERWSGPGLGSVRPLPMEASASWFT